MPDVGFVLPLSTLRPSAPGFPWIPVNPIGPGGPTLVGRVTELPLVILNSVSLVIVRV